ncbi:MAG: type I pullulanase [Bacillota bacterium]|nr:type I pullulanase [Bacillota bacterium]
MNKEDLYKAYVDLDIKLGLDYSKEKSTFRVYSPANNNLKLRIFQSAKDIVGMTYTMTKDPNGVFYKSISGDLDGCYYAYITDQDLEVSDPYAIGAMINSRKAAIVDLADTNPAGFLDHKKPQTKVSEAIIYELHIKDFSFSENSAAKNRGKYLGLAERGTRYKDLATGLDHLVDLGISHVHLLPVYDFLTVNESKESFFEDNNYNWGYDPMFFNLPEGSYASQPQEPKNRIRELKQLIMALHQAGLKVVLDVVYNHHYLGGKSNFEVLCPGCYFRKDDQGNFSNGSGVGNEFKSEGKMARKFIVDSIKYWMKEYKVDGFRFDLMGLIDIDTMEELVREARRIDPDVLIYGEPWLGGESTLAVEKRSLKGKQRSKGFACFNDNLRDCIKGGNRGSSQGFVMGDTSKKICIETGIAGSIDLDDNHQGFTDQAQESINYVNSHDDLILWDKIDLSFQGASYEEKVAAYKLANSIIFLSFGLPFIHEGNEFLRNKKGQANSYNSPISLNQVDWDLKAKNLQVYKFFKDLISLRKSLSFFSDYKAQDIREKLLFLDLADRPIISYFIKDRDKFYFISHNGGKVTESINLENYLPLIKEKFSLDLNLDQVSLKTIFNKNGYCQEDLACPRNIEINSLGSQVIIIEKKM